MSTLFVLISILMEPKCLCCWVEAKLILSPCPPVVMFWFLFSIIPFFDLVYNNYVLLASALAFGLQLHGVTWSLYAYLISAHLLLWLPVVAACGQTHPVPFTHTQEHMFTHPHDQPHPGLHFHTLTHIQSLPFTITQPHSQSFTTIPFPSSPTHSHGILLTFLHIHDQVPARFHSVLHGFIQPRLYTHTQVSSLSHTVTDSHSVPLPLNLTIPHIQAKSHIHTQCHSHSS